MNGVSLVRLNVDEAIERMGDREIFMEIARFFAGQLPESIRDLERALVEGKLEDAGRMAHSLKSNCATMGAELLREKCQSMEHKCRDGDNSGAREMFFSLKPSFTELQRRLEGITA